MKADFDQVKQLLPWNVDGILKQELDRHPKLVDCLDVPVRLLFVYI